MLKYDCDFIFYTILDKLRQLKRFGGIPQHIVGIYFSSLFFLWSAALYPTPYRWIILFTSMYDKFQRKKKPLCGEWVNFVHGYSFSFFFFSFSYHRPFNLNFTNNLNFTINFTWPCLHFSNRFFFSFWFFLWMNDTFYFSICCLKCAYVCGVCPMHISSRWRSEQKRKKTISYDCGRAAIMVSLFFFFFLTFVSW